MLRFLASVFFFTIFVGASFASSLLQTTTPEQCAIASKKDAENGNVSAQTLLAYCYSLTGLPDDLKDAFHWYSKAAKAGDATAQNNLGQMLLEGKPYKKHERLAAQWFLESAMRGNRQGQFNIASAYRLGRGVRKDEEKALKWYKEAAYQNHPFAMNSLSYMYKKGIGMDAPDPEKAAYWRKHAVMATDQATRKGWKDYWAE